MWGVFSIQDPWRHGVVGEIRQGVNLARAAKQAGVEQFVYTSVATAERRTGVPHFESKGQIERAVADLGLAATIIRPVFFMDVLLKRFDDNAGLLRSSLRAGLGSTGRLQLISVHDIARVAVESFTNPGNYAGRAIELASEELSVPQVEAAIRDSGQELPFAPPLPLWLVGLANKEAEINFRWIGEAGWSVDLAAVRREFPWLLSMRDWLATLG